VVVIFTGINAATITGTTKKPVSSLAGNYAAFGATITGTTKKPVSTLAGTYAAFVGTITCTTKKAGNLTNTKNVFYHLSAWVASRVYAVGNRVSNGGNVYQCAIGGTSGSTAPTGSGGTIADGSVTWTYIATYDYASLPAWQADTTNQPLILAVPYKVLLWNTTAYGGSSSTITPIAGPVFALGGHTTSVTNTITIQPAPGEGFRDQLVKGVIPLAFNASAGVSFTLRIGDTPSSFFQVTDGNTILSGLQFLDPATTPSHWIILNLDNGVIVSGCIVDGQAQSAWMLDGDGSIVVENSQFVDRGPASNPSTLVVNGVAEFINNTVVSINSSAGATAVFATTGLVYNCIFTGYQSAYVLGASSSITCGYSLFTDVLPTATNLTVASGNLASMSAANQFISPTTDFRLKSGADAIGAGTNELAYIPLGNDIAGAVRSRWDIGAYNYTSNMLNAATRKPVTSIAAKSIDNAVLAFTTRKPVLSLTGTFAAAPNETGTLALATRKPTVSLIGAESINGQLALLSRKPVTVVLAPIDDPINAVTRKPVCSFVSTFLYIRNIFYNLSAWAGSRLYVVGNRVSNGGNVYQCAVGGTSGSTAPTGSGGTIADGSVTWTYISTFDYASLAALIADTTGTPSSMTVPLKILLWNTAPYGSTATTISLSALTDLSRFAPSFLTIAAAPGESFRDTMKAAPSTPLAFNAANGVSITAVGAPAGFLTGSLFTNVNIEGIQFHDTGGYAGGAAIVSTYGTIKNCIFDTSAASQPNIQAGNIYNTLIVDRSASGVEETLVFVNYSFVNNTVVNPNSSTRTVLGSGAALNCIFYNYYYGSVFLNSSGVYAGSAGGTYSVFYHPVYNTAPSGTGNLAYFDSANPFVSATTDFHLSTNSAAIGSGFADTTDLPAANDIVGQARGRWDMGAIEMSPWLNLTPRKPITAIAAVYSDAAVVTAHSRKPVCSLAGAIIPNETAIIVAGTRKTVSSLSGAFTAGAPNETGTVSAQSRKPATSATGIYTPASGETGSISISTRKPTTTITGTFSAAAGETGSILAQPRKPQISATGIYTPASGETGSILAQPRKPQISVAGTAISGETGSIAAQPRKPICSFAGTVPLAISGSIADLTRKPTSALSGTWVAPPASETGSIHAIPRKPTAALSGNVAVSCVITSHTHKPATSITGVQVLHATINATTRKPTAAVKAVCSDPAVVTAATRKPVSAVTGRAVPGTTGLISMTMRKPVSAVTGRAVPGTTGLISMTMRKLASAVTGRAVPGATGTASSVTRKPGISLVLTDHATTAGSIHSGTRKPVTAATAAALNPLSAAVTSQTRKPHCSIAGVLSERGVAAAMSRKPQTNLVGVLLDRGVVVATTKRVVSTIQGTQNESGPLNLACRKPLSVLTGVSRNNPTGTVSEATRKPYSAIAAVYLADYVLTATGAVTLVLTASGSLMVRGNTDSRVSTGYEKRIVG
jgi:hypothetical protein